MSGPNWLDETQYRKDLVEKVRQIGASDFCVAWHILMHNLCDWRVFAYLRGSVPSAERPWKAEIPDESWEIPMDNDDKKNQWRRFFDVHFENLFNNKKWYLTWDKTEGIKMETKADECSYRTINLFGYMEWLDQVQWNQIRALEYPYRVHCDSIRHKNKRKFDDFQQITETFIHDPEPLARGILFGPMTIALISIDSTVESHPPLACARNQTSGKFHCVLVNMLYGQETRNVLRVINRRLNVKLQRGDR